MAPSLRKQTDHRCKFYCFRDAVQGADSMMILSVSTVKN